LENAGIISSYVALLSAEKLGMASSVFVQVTLENQRRENLARFEEAITHCREIMECFLMTGDADYLLRLSVKDAADYERLHHDVLTRLPGVQRVNSNYAIRKVFRRTALPLAVGKGNKGL
jgi:DNA-binding Lrp family transcriptional regulator